MKAYKGFDKNLRCDPTGKKPFQYEIGKTYEEPEADFCNSGFHACENPLDVFSYYPPSDSRYCEVELDDVSDKKSDDSKVCGKKIKIGAEIGLNGLIKAGVKFIFNKVDWKNSAATNTGDQSAATNTGYRSAAVVLGKESIAIATGYESKAKGKKGCWLVLTEWEKTAEHIKCVKSYKVDGRRIKADTFYTLKIFFLGYLCEIRTLKSVMIKQRICNEIGYQIF